MVAAVRKPAAAAPAVVGVNFGDLDFYSGGFTIPEGDYVIADMTVKMYKFVNAQGVETATPPVLGVVVTLQSMAEPAAEFRTQFYSMGGSADKSFMPNPVTGKGLVAVPGGPAAGMNNMTNWATFLKSWYDAGLPAGIFTNDVSVFEGAHVHMAQVPEPLERKGFATAATSEVQAPKNDRPKTILVVTEIKEDGKPWENTGGLLEAGAAPVKAAAKPNGAVKTPVTVAAAAVAGEEVADDVMIAASDAATAVFANNPDGCAKLVLQMATFKSVKAKYGEPMAQTVINTYYKGDKATEALSDLLGPLGFKVVGPDVKLAA
ncbi:MAG: hypothetical protein ACREJN_07095 [Nitrospiraceae bacterium]